ncbi:hypothetical protein [Terrihabitans rhizophilus]|uniref:Uncharacterized protein n=1 Tax=Terrihabitans rhizophilus TaxID=3092662 RepID=A0ABU4RNC6_9HYPH|nr:hypothetical protein [Terrihabitans sp. PJ23]MDX6806327.1 hypothetical protein [Terrihabitans sp. PJ23]
MKDTATGFVIRILISRDVQAVIDRLSLTAQDLHRVASETFDAHGSVRGRLALTVGDFAQLA